MDKPWVRWPRPQFGHLGDNWRHECTAGSEDLDPRIVLGTVPDRLLPYWGCGAIPYAYGGCSTAMTTKQPVPNPPAELWPWAKALAPTGKYRPARHMTGALTADHCGPPGYRFAWNASTIVLGIRPRSETS
ncbi:hypothetical protein Ari01nite_21010 [Paractinoplanes rishiriensis]|uniref:Uncharacterized protein n=1 Tax=Paractinoplanes rishiriensis TaxID=1050105 RepID=A0A919JT08_9ACTN|nr:hypothetical protein Ari01nite_21010 [Actinoplanes rishiriensis]